MIKLTLLTRNGCHLCDEMKALIRRVQRAYDLILEEIDVDARPELKQTLGNEVPVILCGTAVVARHRITEAQLAAAIRKYPTSQ